MSITCQATTNEVGEVWGAVLDIRIDITPENLQIQYDTTTGKLKHTVYKNLMGPRPTMKEPVWDSLLTLFSIQLSGHK